MIYFDKATQEHILRRFVPLLKPGGLMFAGHAEYYSQISRDFYLRRQRVLGWLGRGNEQNQRTVRRFCGLDAVADDRNSKRLTR